MKVKVVGVISVHRQKGDIHNSKDYKCQVISDGQEELTLDYCYRLICDVPRTVKEAMASPNSELWSKAMLKEMDSLRQNDTFTPFTKYDLCA